MFLSILKIDKVLSVFKKDSKLDYQNYRLIFLISNIKKILQKFIYKRLYQFLKENSVGFRQRFSHTCAILSLNEIIKQALDEGASGYGIFLDVQKAFDTVEHEILQQTCITILCLLQQTVGLNPTLLFVNSMSI